MTMTAFVRAIELFQGGNHEEALQLFVTLAAEASDPREKAGYLLDQANCYLELDRHEEAGGCLANAEELAGRDPMARITVWLGRACYMIEQDRFPDALKILNNILDDTAAHPEDTDFRCLLREVSLQRSVVLIHLARFGEAISELEKISAQQPDGEVYCYLARCYYETQRHGDAKQAFELGIRYKVPEESQTEFHYLCGRNYWELGDYANAKRHLLISAQNCSSSSPQSRAHDMLAATSRLLAGLEDPPKYAPVRGF